MAQQWLWVCSAMLCLWYMCRQLAANLDAATNLEQLQLLVNRHAHQMSAQLFTRAIVKTPQVRALLLEAQPG
jgi:hypothetical protein